MSSGPLFGSVAWPVRMPPKRSPADQMIRAAITAITRAARVTGGTKTPARAKAKAAASAAGRPDEDGQQRAKHGRAGGARERAGARGRGRRRGPHRATTSPVTTRSCLPGLPARSPATADPRPAHRLDPYDQTRVELRNAGLGQQRDAMRRQPGVDDAASIASNTSRTCRANATVACCGVPPRWRTRSRTPRPRPRPG
jgi:hypothetical protein